MGHQRQHPPILATNATDAFRRAVGIRRVGIGGVQGLIVHVLEGYLVFGTEMIDRR